MREVRGDFSRALEYLASEARRDDKLVFAVAIKSRHIELSGRDSEMVAMKMLARLGDAIQVGEAK